MKELADMDWVDAISRMHPLLLHLPIGLIVALIWLQLISVFKGLREGARGARTGLISLLMITTPAAAVSGWFLADGSKYPDPIDLHKWLGVGLAALSLLLAWSHFRGSRAYTPLLWITALLLIPTAHNGADLTHGEGFLTEPWLKGEEPTEAQPAELPAPSAYVNSNITHSDPNTDVSQPGPATNITSEFEPDPSAEGQSAAPSADVVPFEEALSVFEDLCFRCHGERKQKGGLAMHTLEAILRGGDSGPAVVFGDPEASLFLKAMRHPLDHDEHMPPAMKAQPDPEEVDLLERWVMTASAAAISAPAATPESALPPIDEPSADQLPPRTNEPAPTESGEPEVPEPEEPAEEGSAGEPLGYFAGLAKRQIHVQTIAPGSDLIWMELSAAKIEPGELSTLLGPVSNRIADLGLARKHLGAEDLTCVASLPKLTRLDLRYLEKTGLENGAYDLTPLTASKSIRVLNLSGTPIAKTGVLALSKMGSLQRVSLAGTGLEDELPKLRELRPELAIKLGMEPREALEVEPEVEFHLDTESE